MKNRICLQLSVLRGKSAKEALYLSLPPSVGPVCLRNTLSIIDVIYYALSTDHTRSEIRIFLSIVIVKVKDKKDKVKKRRYL